MPAKTAKATGRPPAGRAVAGAGKAARRPGRTTAKRSLRKAEGTRPFTVFLDRDGVLNENPGLQVRRWKDFRFLPGVPEALARLKAAGARLVLVTNQPGTMMLLSTPGMIHRLHDRMQEDLDLHHARLDRIEASFTFLPTRRRKPRPGMLEDATATLAEEGFAVDRTRAVMVGDKVKDAEAGHRFGIPAILVATTHDATTLGAHALKRGVPVVAIVDGLPAAADTILRMMEGQR